MEFCIVSPPTVTEFRKDLAESEAVLRLAEHAPVGVLTLAAVLSGQGRQPGFADMNSLYYEYLHSGGPKKTNVDFCTHAVDELLARDPDVVGFGTICSSYPLTLRIAEGLRRARPDLRIVLGGPQASSVDVSTLRQFPFVDFVVRFEAEETLPQLLDALEANRGVERVPGLTFRVGGNVVRNPDAPVTADLNALPLPAYHLYPHLRKARYLPLELGRGCPYGCTFCSTNDFFRRKFRLKSPRLIVEQMRRLRAEYNVAVFDLIHDMFTVDRKKVVEFCEVLLESEEEFHWNCSARTDRVDDQLLELMSRAGCRGVFFGIETGSQALQRTVKKGLVLSDAIARVRAASDNKMQAAVSLITGFPGENQKDFHDTVDFFMSSLRYENAVPQLHVLAPLANTPIHREFKDQLVFDDIISDMSHQGWEQDRKDRALIAAHPDVFPNFCAVPTPLSRPYIREVRSFLLTGLRTFRWLLVALHQETGHILKVFDKFQEWRRGQARNAAHEQSDDVPYYQGREFREDFIAFARACYVDDSPVGSALEALLDYATSFDEIKVDDPAFDVPVADEADDGRMLRTAFGVNSVPGLADRVKILEVGVDYRALMECLVERRSLDRVPRADRHKLASRKLPGRWPEVLDLSPLSAVLLELCNGVRTVEEIASEITSSPTMLDGVRADKATLVGLEMLRHDGLIEEVSAVS